MKPIYMSADTLLIQPTGVKGITLLLVVAGNH